MVFAFAVLGGLGSGCGGDGPGAADAPASAIDAQVGTPDAAGSSTTVTRSIGAAGGTLTVDGAVLTIPAGALATTTSLTLTKTAGALAGPFFNTSAVYEMLPNGQTFAVPVSLAITYPTGQTPGSRMYWSSLGVVTPASASDYDSLTPTVSGQTFTATNTHFSTCGVGDCKCQ
jgi:hypothetical protein